MNYFKKMKKPDGAYPTMNERSNECCLRDKKPPREEGTKPITDTSNSSQLNPYKDIHKFNKNK